MKHRYELSKFDFAEADAIADHLSAMAAKGWQMDRTGPYLWRYRKAPPQTRRYTVGYLPGPHSAAPLPPEDLAAFRDRYRAAGWDFVTDWYFVQFFSTDRDDVTLPVSDERVKYYALRRSIGKQIWLNALFAALIALLLWAVIAAFLRNPLQYFSTNTTLMVPWILLAALLAIAAPVIRYGLWSRRAEKAVNAGGHCPRLGKRHRRFWDGVLWLILLLFAAAMVSDALTTTGASRNILRIGVWIVGLMALNALLGQIRRSSSPGVFWAAFILGLIVLVVVYLTLPEPYENRIVQREDLPLSLEDLGYAEEDGFCRQRIAQSVLLRYTQVEEYQDNEALYYTIYEPAADRMRYFCRAEAEGYLVWEPLSDGIWASVEDPIYRVPYLAYLIETDDAIIRLIPPDPLDADQLAAAISLLDP